MNFTIKTDHEERLVIIKPDCLLDQSVRKKILSAVAFNQKIHPYRRFLVDLTGSSFSREDTMVGAFELTVYMRDIGISAGIKIAFVRSEDENTLEFFERAARADGYSIRCFRVLDDAAEWLRE